MKILRDVIGINDKGQICDPYEHVIGYKKGYLSASLTSKSGKFKAYTEQQLRELIESGKFSKHGVIRMIPKDANTTSGGSGLTPVEYKGMKLR